MSRTFFVKFNIDTFRDDLAKLDGSPDAAYREWMRGFNRGVGGVCPTSESGPLRMGLDMGYAAFLSAEDFRSKQSEKGKRSAGKRSTTVQPRFNHGSTKPPTELQVASSQKPEANTEKLEAAPASHCDIFDTSPSSDEPMVPTSASNIMACDAKFTHGDLLSQVKRIGGKLTKANGNLAEWEGIIAEHGWDAVSHAAKKVGPAERWPDRVAQVIFDKDKNPHPPGTDAYQNWWAWHMEVK